MFWTHWRQEGCWRHMCVSCSFFRQSWCLAVYHDRFSDFEQELQQISSATVSAFTFIPNIIKFELDRSLAPFLSFFLHPKGKNVTRNMYKITSNQYNMSGRPSAGGSRCEGWYFIFSAMRLLPCLSRLCVSAGGRVQAADEEQRCEISHLQP